MAHVVFLRAANVGGHNVFRPAQLAKELNKLDVVNVGAAGTYVVRSGASRAEIAKTIASKLPFELEMCVIPARQIAELMALDHFAGAKFSREQRGFVAALAKTPTLTPTLPVVIGKPAGWVIKLEHVHGQFALGMWHWRPGGFYIPANVVEKHLGVRSTVRWWETLVKIAKVLKA